MKYRRLFSLKTFIQAGLLVMLSFVFAIISFAATIGLAPSSGKFKAGDTFSVSVSVSSTDQPMNALSGTISFPTNVLEVTSVSRGGSIVQIWVREPSFSNSTGTIQFEGVILNPGFQGAGGNVMTINFRAKSAGTAPVNFLSGSILANDGKGTSILSGLGSGNFTVIGEDSQTPQQPEEPQTPGEPQKPQVSTPGRPTISSSSHPDSTRWYDNSEVMLSWPLPANISDVSYVIDQNPSTIPPASSTGKTGSVQQKLDDGIWYVHVRFRNQEGWGQTAHFTIRIDTSAPENFQYELLDREDPSSPRLQFSLSAEDKGSGVAFFRLLVEGQDPIEWEAQNNETIYETPSLPSLSTQAELQAVDFAGNIVSQYPDIEITPITAPEILDYHKELESGESFYVHAKTFPNATVFIWVEEGGNTAIRWITKSDRDGLLTFISDQGLRSGNYNVWLQAQDSRGAMSENSDVISIHVAATGFTDFWQSNFQLLLLVLGIAWILFVLIIWYLLARILAFKHRVRDDSRNALMGIHRAFNLLRDDVENEIDDEGDGKGKPLTKKQRQVIRKIQKDLDTVEEYIEQKIHEIDDEVSNAPKDNKNVLQKLKDKLKKQNDE